MNLVASSLTKLLLSYLLSPPECILYMYMKCLLAVLSFHFEDAIICNSVECSP